MSLTPTAIRAAVTGAVAARYPALTVEAHGGRFTEREIPLLLAKAPAILVACTGMARMQSWEAGARWKAELGFALYVFGADTATAARDMLALDVAFDLMTWLPEQRWGCPRPICRPATPSPPTIASSPNSGKRSPPTRSCLPSKQIIAGSRRSTTSTLLVIFFAPLFYVLIYKAMGKRANPAVPEIAGEGASEGKTHE